MHRFGEGPAPPDTSMWRPTQAVSFGEITDSTLVELTEEWSGLRQVFQRLPKSLLEKSASWHDVEGSLRPPPIHGAVSLTLPCGSDTVLRKYSIFLELSVSSAWL